MSSNKEYKRIDHLAIAVKDLEKAVSYYRDVLGMELVERRKTVGKTTAMISAVMSAGGFDIVLMEGVGEDSQITRYIETYGEGVQHVAFEVENLESCVTQLAYDGMAFSTEVINGNQLKQVFSKREENSGMMFELIERKGESGFQDNNVNDLFSQLEKNGDY